MRLIDMGERRLISDLLRTRYAANTWRFGDDTAVVLDGERLGGGRLVATTDPAPEPAAWAHGGFDWYYFGWLTAALNLSDIAAAGAVPAGLLTSFVLSSDLSVAKFERLLDGVDDCCASVGTKVLGGNLKEGDTHCSATAFGVVPSGEPLSRHGAAPGHTIFAIGDTGYFWAGMLAFDNSLTLPDDERAALFDALLKPVPRVAVGRALQSRGLVAACTDNSDGLYGSLWCLTQSNGHGVMVEPEHMRYQGIVTRIADRYGHDPLRLALGFGDLQLVCAVAPERVAELLELCSAQGWGVFRVGTVTDRPGFYLEGTAGPVELLNLDNERFTYESQFTGGLDGYRKRLLEGPITKG
ncbi:MAG TPA: AIR synthase related protein [Dactylosporangium sp.]|jgi:thiamine-monophosphate kinase|nr:AIR synthase related protein [Dactylosporangium sp.]